MKKASHPTKDAMWIRSGFNKGEYVRIETLKKRHTASGENNETKIKRQTPSLQDKAAIKLSVSIIFLYFILMNH